MTDQHTASDKEARIAELEKENEALKAEIENLKEALFEASFSPGEL